MIKKFGVAILGGMLLIGGLTARAQETVEKEVAVKLGSGATLKNTIIWGNKGKQVGEVGPTPVNCYIQRAGLASPLFVDSVNYDFRLKKGSPCIDGGMDDVKGSFFTEEAVDLWGNKRFVGKVDIGAHEYTFYKVYFDAPSKVVIASVKDADGCDRDRVEPGHTYRFKIDFSQIVGITADMVTVKMLTGDVPIDSDENGIYTIENISSDVYVKVTVTPPVVVSVEIPEHGQLQVTGGGKTVPQREGEKVTTSLVVEENARVTLDTVPDAGYYCTDVWVQKTKEETPSRVSVKDKVGTGKSYQVGKEDVTFTAEYAPYSYPVTLKVNDRNMGALTVTNNKNATSWNVPEGNTEKSYSCLYDPDMQLTIAVTPAAGYDVKSVKVYDRKGSDPTDLTLADERKTSLQVGGLTVEAVFEPKMYTVSWHCEHGTLTLNYGTPERDPSTGMYSVKVPYNQQLTIGLTGDNGYEYKAGSLKATVQGTEYAIADASKQWTVKDNTSLSAVFVLKKYQVTVTSNLAGITDFYTVDPALPADGKVEHGTSLTFKPKDIEGYDCKEIQEDGVFAGSAVSLAILSVTSNKTIRFVFEKKTCQVVYNTPTNGSLTVKSGSSASGPWTTTGSSPVSVAYGDYLQIVVAADPHYKLKSLKIERLTAGTSVEKVDDGTYTEGPVKENIRITAAFEPQKYTVVLSKASTGNPEKGKVSLKDAAGGVWGTVEKTGTSPVSIPNVPYNTRLWVTVDADEGYGATAMDTLAGGNKGSIKEPKNFLVTQDATVTVEIGAVTDMYTVDWKIDAPQGSSSALRVTTEDGSEEIVKRNSYVSGKQLLLKAVSEARDTFQYVKDQNGTTSSSWKTSWTLTGNTLFTAKFVRKCTVKIASVDHAALEVWKDGVKLTDGTVVPAGSELTVKMNADAGAGCDKITADNNELWSRPSVATTGPVASHEESYTISAKHAGGEIWFRGEAREYYKIKFTAADFGKFSVTVAGTSLSAGTDYWYAAGTKVVLRAEETTTGYCFNADKKVKNRASGSSGDIVLAEGTPAGVYTKELTLSENLDLTTEFVRKKYSVHIKVSPEGTTLAGVGASLSVTGGDPVLTDFGTTMVEHGSSLTISANAGMGYVVRILKADNSVVGTSGSSASHTTPQITGESTYTVKFVKLYQVFYDTDDIAKVVKTDGSVLTNGAYAYEGESLKAVSVQKPGMKCTKVKISDNLSGEGYASATETLANRTVECSFVMPAKDVKVSAEFELLKYNLESSLVAPDGSAVLEVVKTDGINDVPVEDGTGVLSYGDRLKITLRLTPESVGSSKTWYEVKSVKALMGSVETGLTSSVSGLNHVYTFTADVIDHVNITAEVVRRQGGLILRVDPADQGFSIELQIDGGTSRFFTGAYQRILVPVGASVKAWPRIGTSTPEGYELGYFPAEGRKETSLSLTMPLEDGDRTLQAKFTLKKFPLHIQVVPAAGGAVSVTDGQGRNYTSGNYRLEYGTALTAITVEAADAYHHFDGITGYMGGTDRLSGQTAPYHIDKMVDSVGIEARFSRRYRIRRNTVTNGSLSVKERVTAADATDKYYPAGTRFEVQVVPADESYECTGITLFFSGVSLASTSLTPDEEGKASYTIPDGLTARDISFSASFEKKKYRIVLKRMPQEGGSAEVWSGDNVSGSLLAELPQGNSETEVAVEEVEHGSLLTLYAAAASPDFEVAARTLGANIPYTGPLTLVSDTVLTVRFGRLYILTFKENITVRKAADDTYLTSGVRIPEGMQLIAKAQRTGHDCTRLVADSTSDSGKGTYHSWTDPNADGIIEKTFSMAGGNVDLEASFEPKRFKVKIIQQPGPLAFNVLDVTVTPQEGDAFVVDTVQGSLAKYLSGLSLTKLELHPWFEGPVSVTAEMKGDPMVYDLQNSGLTVKDSVTVTAVAHRKQKKLTVHMQAETGAVGNQVVVQTEDGQEHIFRAAGTLTVDVGAPLKIRTVEGEGCRTSRLVTTPPGNNAVTLPPFELTVEHMPDEDVTVTAEFLLKRYPVYFTANAGGTLTVNKKFGGVSEGILTASGEEVKHFTELEIAAQPAGPAYRLKNLRTSMGGVTVSDPAKIASVTAAVNIEAEFERIYEVRKIDPDPAKGTLSVSRADTNAVGYRYPAATTVVAEVLPRTGYEVVSLMMNGVAQPMVPEGGRVVCTLPGANPAVDSVVFEVQYALKKYDVVFIASGEGQMTVDGLPGGTLRIENTNRSRWVEHFTRLHLSVMPHSDAYRVAEFGIHLDGGQVIPVTAADTTIEITGDADIEVRFLKYYWVVYDGAPAYGKLVVNESDTLVRSGARYPGRTVLDVRALPDEGYEAVPGYPRWNEGKVANNTVILPQEDASYDTVRLETRFQIRKCRVAVTQPDSGYIRVERLDENNNWVNLDITQPVELDYWTQIRMTTGVYNSAGYKVEELLVNGQPFGEQEVWTVRGDCEVTARVVPRLYVITYAEPAFGHLRVETPEGELVSGAEVAYRTQLVVTAVPDDPEGYEVNGVRINGQPVENGIRWTVLEDTEIAAGISIRQWEVTTSVTGEGTLVLSRPDGSAIQSPSDIVDHYTVLRVKPQADPAWKLYSLQIYGAEMQADSTIMVTRDVEVEVVFRKRETYLFPVAFTPNGDGYNDTWVISGLWQAPENTLEIFNRDQQRLYKAAPYQNEWEGTTDNGKILPAGTYVYKFTAGPGEVYMGLVSIVRN